MNRSKSSWTKKALSRATAGVGWLGMCIAAQGCVSGTTTVEMDASMPNECMCIRGICKADLTCACDQNWTGPTCNECEPGFTGTNCDQPECEGSDCNWCGSDAGCEVHQNDGPLPVTSGELNLSTYQHEGRSCPDGGDAVSYRVAGVASTSATLATVPSAGCLEIGDEVLLINLQGAVGATANVGNYESLRVKSVTGGTIEFETPKQRFYGAATNTDTGIGEGGTQNVMLMRVPNYTDVTIAAGATLTANAWDPIFGTGGVLAMRVMNKVTVAGTITMTGRGYQGGITNNAVLADGQQGEGLAGPGSSLPASNAGGGGAGQGDDMAMTGCGNRYGSAGGGGGHGTAGSLGNQMCCGLAGEVVGHASSDSLELGPAGGSGGADDFITDNPPPGAGGAGGGIILIEASEVSVGGSIQADGRAGIGDILTCEALCGAHDCADVTACFDFSGPGGGGAGGTIVLRGSTIGLGTARVTAKGGLGGVGDAVGNEVSMGSGTGGVGGAGRIFTTGTTSGTSDPAARSN